MQHGQALRARGASLPHVVSHKRRRVIADAQSGSKMDCIEWAKQGVLDGCRPSEDRLVDANEH